jgi:hypothetical protein
VPAVPPTFFLFRDALSIDDDRSGDDLFEVTLTGAGSPEFTLNGKFNNALDPRIL